MDVFSQDKIEYLSNPNSFIKKCINCESVYITEKECEACGFQFKEPDLGEPVGEKSFYSIREKYKTKKNLILKFFFGEKCHKYKEFRNKLIHRFRSILVGMEFPWEDVTKWSYFHFELIDLTKYISNSPSNDIIMDRILISLRQHPFYHEIRETINLERENRFKKQPIPKKIKLYFYFFLVPLFLCVLAPFLYKWVH